VSTQAKEVRSLVLVIATALLVGLLAWRVSQVRREGDRRTVDALASSALVSLAGRTNELPAGSVIVLAQDTVGVAGYEMHEDSVTDSASSAILVLGRLRDGSVDKVRHAGVRAALLAPRSGPRGALTVVLHASVPRDSVARIGSVLVLPEVGLLPLYRAGKP